MAVPLPSIQIDFASILAIGGAWWPAWGELAMFPCPETIERVWVELLPCEELEVDIDLRPFDQGDLF